MRTLDAASGEVVLQIAPGCEQDVELILQDLRRFILLEPAKPEPGNE
jgi:hypothetical protein